MAPQNSTLKFNIQFISGISTDFLHSPNILSNVGKLRKVAVINRRVSAQQKLRSKI